MRQHPLTSVLVKAIGFFLGSLGLLHAPAAWGQRSVTTPETEATSPQAIQAQQLLVRGMTYQQLDDQETALQYFNEALGLAPNEPAILAALAATHEVLDDIPTALFFAEQARQHGSDNVYHYFLVAELHMRAGELSTAEAAYQTLLAQFPDNWDARQSLAQVQTMLGRDHDAIATYEHLIAQAQHYADVRRQILPLYLRVGDMEGAERTLQAITELDPRDAPAWRSLGDLYVRQNKLEAAVHAYEQALHANLNDVYAAMALADVYRALGQNNQADALLDQSLHLESASVEELLTRAELLAATVPPDEETHRSAVQILEHVLERAPQNSNALSLLGQLYFEQGRYAEAAPLLEQALRENPRDPDGWCQAAAAYIEAGDPEQAVEVTEEALLLFPGHLRVLRTSALSLSRSYRHEEAVLRFEEALAIAHEDTPDDITLISDLYAALAQVYDRQKQFATADSIYGRALATDPQNAVALNNHAYSLVNRGERLREARRLAERAVDQAPRNPRYLDTLGWVLFHLEHLDEAEEIFTRALASEQASAAVYEHYGDLRARRGDLESARQYWQQALDKSPDNVALQEKLKEDS